MSAWVVEVAAAGSEKEGDVSGRAAYIFETTVHLAAAPTPSLSKERKSVYTTLPSAPAWPTSTLASAVRGQVISSEAIFAAARQQPRDSRPLTPRPQSKTRNTQADPATLVSDSDDESGECRCGELHEPAASMSGSLVMCCAGLHHCTVFVS